MLDAICSISIAKSNTFDPADKIEFSSVDGQKFSDLGTTITTKTWSPHTWRNGIRRSQNWLSANFIALDFDGGLTLSETRTICEDENLTFLIGTTKSHQVEKTSPGGKVSPAVDRYRVLIATDGPCDSQETYQNTYDYFSILLPTLDESCSDTARYFFPCREIAVLGSGKLFKWIPVTPEEKERRLEAQKRYDEYLAENRGTGIIPSRILSDLTREEHPVGTRHKTCYKIGAQLAQLGFDEQYIVDLVLDSSLVAIGRDDAERAVRNGSRKARGHFPDWWEV